MKCTGVDFRKFLDKFFVEDFSAPCRKIEVEFRDDRETSPNVWGYRITIKDNEGPKLTYVYSDQSSQLQSGGMDNSWTPTPGTYDIVEVFTAKRPGMGNKHVLIRIQENDRFSGG